MFLGEQKNINCSVLYSLSLWGKRLPSKNMKYVKLTKYNQKITQITVNSLRLNSYKKNEAVYYYKFIYDLPSMNYLLLNFTYNKLSLYNLFHYKILLTLNSLTASFPLFTKSKTLKLCKLKKLLNN